MANYNIDSGAESTIAAEAAVAYKREVDLYARVVSILGGKAIISHKITNEIDLITLTRTGLPKHTISSLALKLKISHERLSQLLHISYRTIQRKADHDHLSVHVSEQILAIARVIARGIDVLGSQEAWERWVHAELRSLHHKRPIDYMDTMYGTEMLLKILGRIEYGVY